jgi:transposase
MGRYSREFKEEALKLVMQQGYTPAEAARKLSIPDTTYETWLKKIGWVKPPSKPLPDDPQALKVRVRELEKQLKRAQEEKEILKKATAYFANLHK